MEINTSPEKKIKKLIKILDCRTATELRKALGNVAHSTIEIEGLIK